MDEAASPCLHFRGGEKRAKKTSPQKREADARRRQATAASGHQGCMAAEQAVHWWRCPQHRRFLALSPSRSYRSLSVANGVRSNGSFSTPESVSKRLPGPREQIEERPPSVSQWTHTSPQAQKKARKEKEKGRRSQGLIRTHARTGWPRLFPLFLCLGLFSSTFGCDRQPNGKDASVVAFVVASPPSDEALRNDEKSLFCDASRRSNGLALSREECFSTDTRRLSCPSSSSASLASSPFSSSPSSSSASGSSLSSSSSPLCVSVPSGSSTEARKILEGRMARLSPRECRRDEAGVVWPFRDAPFLLEKQPLLTHEPVHFFALLPLHPGGKTNRASSTPFPVVLVATCSRSGVLSLFPAGGDGEVLASLATGHASPVAAFAAFHRPDEDSFLAALDMSGELRVLSVSTRLTTVSVCPHMNNRRQNESQGGSSSSCSPERNAEFKEKVARSLALKPKVKLEPDVLVHHPFLSSSSERKVTNFLVISHKGEKMFLLSDSQGWITILTRAGTLRKRVKVTEEAGGVRHIVHSSGVVVFSTARTFAMFSVALMDISGAIGIVGARSPISSLAIDPTKQTRLAVALEDGQILYYDLKKASLLHKFPSSSRAPTQLIFTKEAIFAMSVENGKDSFFLSFDVREAEAPRSNAASEGNSGTSFLPADRFILENFEGASLTSFYRFGETLLLAVASRRGDEVRFFEPSARQWLPPEEEPWFHFRLPVLVVALVAVLVFRLFRADRLSLPRTERAEVFRERQGWKDRAGPEEFPSLREEFTRFFAKARGAPSRGFSASPFEGNSLRFRPRGKRRHFFHSPSSASETACRRKREETAEAGSLPAHANGISLEKDALGAPRVSSSDSDFH
ncbi:hypothetical protein TGP89_238140 [Toxoplasma gondii p89]|uniref:Uncharacterized protein n=1 Tax=Toxoplasma gondii p89 TaxID=943119 RepID=A0A086K4Q3_TOXGO|nr:hypothetical protein TGP89_238140 [Toxoplasma gondii p89]